MPTDDIIQNGQHIANGPLKDGYRLYRLEGLAFNPRRPPPAGTVPLFSWYHPGRGDNFATSDPRWSIPVSRIRWNGQHISNGISKDGYGLYRLEGFIYDPRRPQPAGTVPLFSWYHPERGDNFTSSDSRWSMPVRDIRWGGHHISNGPVKDGYRLYRLEGFVRPSTVGSAPHLKALVSSQHGEDYSSAAINIESQVGKTPGKISLNNSTHAFRLHGADSGGTKTHYQGVGFLRDKTVNSGLVRQRYRRAVLSYNYEHGLMISSARMGAGILDGVEAWDSERRIRFQGNDEYLDITEVPTMGNHRHPGGLQSHGDLIAIAMEQPRFSGTAAAYFIRVDGLFPRFVSSVHLGSGGAPGGLNVASAASSGFLKLESGYLLAVSGARNGTEGIWFYKTLSNEISARTRWSFVDFWTPDQMPGGICDIDEGRHSTNCYVGAGGGLSLIANNDGHIYMIATTGTDGSGDDYEYAQMYKILILESAGPTSVHMRAVWSDSKNVGQRPKLRTESCVSRNRLRKWFSLNAFLMVIPRSMLSKNVTAYVDLNPVRAKMMSSP